MCLLRQIRQYIRKEWTLLKPNLDHRSPAVICSHERKDHLMPMSHQAPEYHLWQIDHFRPPCSEMYLILYIYLLKKCENLHGNLYLVYCQWFLLLLHCMMFSTALLHVWAFVLCLSFTFFNDMFIIPIIMFLPCWNYVTVIKIEYFSW